MRKINSYIRAILPRDSQSNVPVEYCLSFTLIALLTSLKVIALTCNHAFSLVAITIPPRPEVTQQSLETGKSADDKPSRNEKHVLGFESIPVGTPLSSSDLVPTAIRMLGNVVYLHAPTGRLLIEVSSLLPSLQSVNLDLGTQPALEQETGEIKGNWNHQGNVVGDCPPSLQKDIATTLSSENEVSSPRKTSSRRGYKQRAREQSVVIEPEKLYTPSQVAAALNISYDAALRKMARMKGVVDLGTPTRRYKRGKKILRITGKNLSAFLGTKTLI